MRTDARIRVEGTDLAFDAASDQPVLDSALDAGIRLPHNCRGGICGTCRATVVSGTLDAESSVQYALTQRERENGVWLLCQARPTASDVVVRVHAPLPPQPKAAAARPQTFLCETVAARPVTPRVRELVFALPKTARFVFKAGMHVEIAVPGIEPPRTYSMLDAPGPDGMPVDGLLRFLVARQAPGAASAWLHETLRPGMVSSLTGPFGTFGLPERVPGPILGLAGGTGIAPVLAVVEEALSAGFSAPVTLVLSVRDRDEILAMDAFSRIARRHENFSWKVTLTREHPPPGTRFGIGRIPDMLHRVHGQLAHHTVLIAGTPGFVDACEARVQALGAAPDRIAVDSFLPADPATSQ